MRRRVPCPAWSARRFQWPLSVGNWRAGWLVAGQRVLLLHGGPGLSFEYLDGLADEIGAGYAIAGYQQRGLAPSLRSGTFNLETAIADAVAVLDALQWDRVWLVGHSWGGHLLLRLLVSATPRVYGGLAIDPLGGVGDGGWLPLRRSCLRGRVRATVGARRSSTSARCAAKALPRTRWRASAWCGPRTSPRANASCHFLRCAPA
jgi:pimeloyl-ACP methyl ester carboxylesterase